MSKKPCPVCGTNYFGASGPHSEVCTPALRRLVRAAEKWNVWVTPHATEALLCWEEVELRRAVRAWRKEREK